MDCCVLSCGRNHIKFFFNSYILHLIEPPESTTMVKRHLCIHMR